jgi:hypothetical protein
MKDGIPHNCPNKALEQFRPTFDRASDLMDRKLIQRSRVQINEVNRQLIHSRLEIIVRPKAKPEVRP